MGTHGGLRLLDGGQDLRRARPSPLTPRDCQRQALRTTSQALLEAGPQVQRLASVLATSLAELVGGACIIRGPMDRALGLPLACAHSNASTLDVLRTYFNASPHALAYACSVQATRTRKLIQLPQVSAEVLQLWTQPAAWPYLLQHQVRSLLVAPVHSGRTVRATIVLWREHPSRQLTDAHASLLTEVARRIAPALCDGKQRRLRLIRSA